jgi:phosphoglycerate dehydrogenase-like enzyme
MRIWCDFVPGGAAAELLRGGIGQNELVFRERGASARHAEVALGQPDPADILAATTLRWLHITSAGYTKFDFPEFWQGVRARGIAVTNSSSVFAEPCAEHALAMILSFARALPWALREQFPSGGAAAAEPSHPHSPTWTSDPIRKRSFLLTDQRIVLVGYGAIARRLIEMLAPFTKNIVGVRRNPRGDEGIRVVGLDRAATELAAADHVVDLLPQSAETEQLFDATRIAQIRPGAFFYNIGRGKTVDQPALIAALTSGRVAAAYLDVTDPEPLPANHPLWRVPNCFITPHSAGGHHNERDRLVEHFLGNLRQYERGQKLTDRIGIS